MGRDFTSWGRGFRFGYESNRGVNEKGLQKDVWSKDEPEKKKVYSVQNHVNR